MYVCNVDEASAVNGNKYVDAVREAVKDEDAQILVVAAKIESEIAEFDTYEERQMFLQEIGLEESGVSRLIKSAYKLLNLQTFLTAGSTNVVRGRSIKAGKLLNARCYPYGLRKRIYPCRGDQVRGLYRLWLRGCC